MLSLVLPSSEPVIVNKAELAKRLGVSLPTIAALIDRYTDFPIVQKGTNGTPWRFDLAAVIAYVQAKRESEQASRAARDEQLAQLVLPIELAPAEKPAGLSIKDQLDAARLRETLRKEAIANGDLVPAAEMQDAVTTLLATLNRGLHQFLGQLAREQSWPDPVLAAARARLAELQETLVTDLPTLLPTTDGDERQSRFA